MDDIINFIAAYKKLYGEFPKYIVMPAHAGKTVYVITEVHPFQDTAYIPGLYVHPVGFACLTPPVEIPILAEEPKAQ